MTTTPEAGARRRYDSTLRRAQAAQTRERILDAAAGLLRDASIRDWDGLTIRAVAEHAGVHERTVYRHFANERALRDSLMHRLEDDAGVDLARLRLDEVAQVAARTLRYVSAYRLAPRPPLDPTLTEAMERQHDALLGALVEHTVDWSDDDRRIAAAVLDVLWSLSTHERLVGDWDLDREAAIRAVTWAIGLVEEAVREGRRPQI
jgi:AcrR family transcriptional regulator